MHSKIIAKVLVVNDAGEILCLVRSKSDYNRPGGWDFPGGNVEQGEEFIQALTREAAEEAGIALQSPRLVYAKTERHEWGVGNWLYFVESVAGRPEVRLSHEHEKAEWLTPEGLLAQDDYDMHHELLGFITKNNLLVA